MKKVILVLALVSLAVWISSCKDEPIQPRIAGDSNSRTVAILPQNSLDPPVPTATVPLLTFPSTRGSATISDLLDPAVLTPESFSATLRAGQSVNEHKNLFLPPNVTPPKLDLLISFDLTGSMGEELANVKANGINIMNAVRLSIPDSKFGLISHMDYPGDFTGCGYTATYGDASSGDYAYSLDEALTTSTTDVATAINGLVLGYGVDGPEDYSRAFYESYNDAGIVWRSGAKKIVLAFLDAVPHDCAYDSILGVGPPFATSGPDPGRDAVVGTPDDLEILKVLDGMAGSNTALITVFSGGWLGLWTAYSQKTGGEAFGINSDGTIPGGVDIAAFITSIVEGSITRFDEVTLETCDPAYAAWLTAVEPVSYTDVELGEPLNLGFDITITVPPGTPSGVYCFDICAVGDEVELATQRVCITVRNEVGFDFHPTSCPNPLNMSSPGISPAAILGAGDFDVMTIDPASIRLEGVAPVRWAISDVSTPFLPFIGKDECMDCTTLGPDGYADLTLKFNTQELAAALTGVANGDCRVVTITGNLKPAYGGGAFVGEDVIKIIIPTRGGKNGGGG
ncbi:MAG TPA: hypothetical protein VI932_02550 [Bacteroidota bacterium]|nr:hypothetical protein [Bacteroidota bacterium]